MAIHWLSDSYYSFRGNVASINKYLINLTVCVIQG